MGRKKEVDRNYHGELNNMSQEEAVSKKRRVG